MPAYLSSSHPAAWLCGRRRPRLPGLLTIIESDPVKGGAGMNWLKVGAVVIGGIVVFFVLDSVVHLLLGLLTAIAFVAIVAGGGYVVYKIMGARRRREVKAKREPEEHRVRRETRPGTPALVVPPVTSQPARHAAVEDELARLKREMGS